MGGTATATRGNLPAELTSFIGRRRQLQEVRAALSSARLITLVGPGGVGKTRLALRAATDVQRGAPDGAWMVELGGLNDPELVPKAVMTSVGLRDESGEWPMSRLIDHVSARRMLLVLDNCEHLLDACAVLADALLREARHLRVLATSRQPLGVAGEHVVQLPPLALPDGLEHASPESVARSEAVALLLERAREAGGPFELDGDNQAAAVDLARRLDGMPLAIELAAVRLRTLGLEQVRERLDDRFRLLVGGSRVAPPRHKTLEATIAWSHDLLGDVERAVLRRLSVFAGTLGLEAAQEVCSQTGVGPDDVLDALTALVERSFVSREGTVSRARYRLHETMREFALARLRDADEEETTRERHCDFFARMCGYTEAGHGRSDDAVLVAWLDVLDAEADNMRAALRHCLDRPWRSDTGLAMAAGLGWYWSNRALSEGVHWVEALLEHRGDDEELLARALFVRSYLAMMQGDADAGLGPVAEAAAILRTGGDADLLTRVLAIATTLHVMAGDVASARETADDARALAGRLGEDIPFIAAAQADAMLALVDGDFARLRDLGLDAAGRCRKRNELYMLGNHLNHAGVGSMMLGEHAAARESLLEALRATRLIDDRPGLVLRVQALATLAALTGQPQRAAKLLGASETLRREAGALSHPLVASLLEQATERAQSDLGDDRFRAAFDAGVALDREAAIALALEETPGRRPPRAPATVADPLGRREREVATLVAEGLTNKEIAGRLFLSERTVETHVYNILNKLGFNTRVQIASWVTAGREPAALT